MPGRLFLVIGAGGSGRTTLLQGAQAALASDPAWHFAAPGEVVAPILAGGRNVVAEARPSALPGLIALFPDCCVVQVDTSPERQRSRIARAAKPLPGWQDPPASPPRGIDTVTVTNYADVAEGVARLVAALRAGIRPRLAVREVPIATWHDNIAYLSSACTAVPATQFLGPGFVEVRGRGHAIRARVHVVNSEDLVRPDEVGLSHHAFRTLGLAEGTPATVDRMPEPGSMGALRAKIRGEELDEAAFGDILRDVADGRYPDREVAAFLVTACASLTDAELEALARVRASLAGRMAWSEKMVADKHSMGGVPGSRITMIVVPIVAAHGIAIPKTSSRAITSASGTADAMEVLANVELTAGDMRRVVTEARGCIAWNGRLNHSPVDDVMNAITRPLGIDSQRWAVASILSKKLAAGATHVAIDIPFGPMAKTRTRAEAEALAGLFARIGAKLGLVLEAWATDGSRPIGCGIGPALEVRDVLRVLDNDADAPADLREKALFFAGRILSWDQAVGAQNGEARARELLASGSARAALDRIVHAQGRRTPAHGIARLARDIRAPRSGRVTGIDGWRISAIARSAGAPMEKGAGVDLMAAVGEDVVAGHSLYRVHAGTEAELDVAAAQALADPGYVIDG
jgi:thymidine phosphorylase